MSTAVAVKYVVPSALLANSVPYVDTSVLTLVDTKEDPKALSRESLYQFTNRPASEVITERLGIYKNPKANEGRGQTNYSLKAVGKAIWMDADDNVVAVDDITITIAMSVPGVDGLPTATTSTGEAYLANAVLAQAALLAPIMNEGTGVTGTMANLSQNLPNNLIATAHWSL